MKPSPSGRRAAPASKRSTTTHLGTPASDVVTLVTETSPTPPGGVARIGFRLRADGRPARFTLPSGTVLVVTDVVVTAPRNNAPAGRYVAAVGNEGAFHSQISIHLDTAVDGFQKTISFSGGVVFSTLPQFETLAANPSDLSVSLYGYLVQNR